MVAIKAHFDGKKIVIPPQIRGGPPREVLLVFEDPPPTKGGDIQLWLKAQEEAFAKVWDNPEDAVYDSL
jgi:hypothetical protein